MDVGVPLRGIRGVPRIGSDVLAREREDGFDLDVDLHSPSMRHGSTTMADPTEAKACAVPAGAPKGNRGGKTLVIDPADHGRSVKVSAVVTGASKNGPPLPVGKFVDITLRDVI